jgi:hypothetical protein
MPDHPNLDATAAPALSGNIEKVRDELLAKRGQLQELDRKRMAGEPFDEAALATLRDEVRKLNELRERIVNREMGVSDFEKARPLDAFLDFLATYKVAIFFIVVIGISVVVLMRIPSGNLTTEEERKAVQKSLGRSPTGNDLGLVGGAVLGRVKENMAPGEKSGAPAPPAKKPAPKKTPAPPAPPSADLPK